MTNPSHRAESTLVGTGIETFYGSNTLEIINQANHVLIAFGNNHGIPTPWLKWGQVENSGQKYFYHDSDQDPALAFRFTVNPLSVQADAMYMLCHSPELTSRQVKVTVRIFPQPPPLVERRRFTNTAQIPAIRLSLNPLHGLFDYLQRTAPRPDPELPEYDPQNPDNVKEWIWYLAKYHYFHDTMPKKIPGIGQAQETPAARRARLNNYLLPPLSEQIHTVATAWRQANLSLVNFPLQEAEPHPEDMLHLAFSDLLLSPAHINMTRRQLTHNYHSNIRERLNWAVDEEYQKTNFSADGQWLSSIAGVKWKDHWVAQYARIIGSADMTSKEVNGLCSTCEHAIMPYHPHAHATTDKRRRCDRIYSNCSGPHDNILTRAVCCSICR